MTDENCKNCYWYDKRLLDFCTLDKIRIDDIFEFRENCDDYFPMEEK